MGGPGALFWMWIMATFGAILKFVGCVLGVLYRQKGQHGEFIGGPMYYIAKGLKQKTLARVYCLFAICAALTVGNMVQMNSLALPFTQAGVHPLLTGLMMSVIVASVILGGLQRFSKIAALVVPFMAVGYIAACLVILLLHVDDLLPALQLIVQSAFSNQAVTGGAAGFAVLQAIRIGFDRGLFATDVGVGIECVALNMRTVDTTGRRERLEQSPHRGRLSVAMCGSAWIMDQKRGQRPTRRIAAA